MKVGDYELHPGALIWHEMSDGDFRELVKSVREVGLVEPITMCDGRVLDGRHRLRACIETGVAMRFVEWDGTGDPILWANAKNGPRRHSTPSQRAAAAVKLLAALKEAARGRQAAAAQETNEKRGRVGKLDAEDASGKDSQSVPEWESSNIAGRARDAAAGRTGANPRYVADAEEAVERAPEVLDAISDGSLNVPQARTVSRLPVGQRAAVIAKVKSGASAREVVKEAVREAERATVTDADGRPIPPELVEAWLATKEWAGGIERALRACAEAWDGSPEKIGAIGKTLGRSPVQDSDYHDVRDFMTRLMEDARMKAREMIPHILCQSCHGGGCRDCWKIGWFGRTGTKRDKAVRETRDKMRREGKL